MLFISSEMVWVSRLHKHINVDWNFGLSSDVLVIMIVLNEGQSSKHCIVQRQKYTYGNDNSIDFRDFRDFARRLYNISY